MAQRMYVQKIHRLTLVRKGKATAKHPDMRGGVVEKVAAIPGTANKFGAVYTGAPVVSPLQRNQRGQWQ